MECNNGETALEILKEQSIDVMFTDIRMPKMDGIELVERMQECEHIPLTVAISGYDDFNYAVAMMHNGVREYLLKPIEREKICDILARLNQEIEEGREQEKTRQKLGQQQTTYGFPLRSKIKCWSYWVSNMVSSSSGISARSIR